MLSDHCIQLLILAQDLAGPDTIWIAAAIYYTFIYGVPIFAVLALIYVVASIYRNRRRK